MSGGGLTIDLFKWATLTDLVKEGLYQDLEGGGGAPGL